MLILCLFADLSTAKKEDIVKHRLIDLQMVTIEVDGSADACFRSFRILFVTIVPRLSGWDILKFLETPDRRFGAH